MCTILTRQPEGNSDQDVVHLNIGFHKETAKMATVPSARVTNSKKRQMLLVTKSLLYLETIISVLELYQVGPAISLRIY